MKGQTYVILGIVILIIVSVFAVTNVAMVEVNYFFWSGDSPLILVILFSVLMGCLIMATVGGFRIVRLQRENKELKANNKEMQTRLMEHDLLEEDTNRTNSQEQSNVEET